MRRQLINIIFISIAFQLYLVSCKKDIDSQSLRPPVSNAGADIYLQLPTDSAILDGTASLKTDHEISNYQWSKVSGPPSYRFRNEYSRSTVVKELEGGVYKFELKVTDVKGSSSRDTVRIIVYEGLNEKPISDAGPDLNISLPTNEVSLQGRGYVNPAYQPVQVWWSKISGPASCRIQNPSQIYTWVSELTVGEYQFELKLTDNIGQSDTDTVLVTVTSPYRDIAPTIYVHCKTIYTNTSIAKAELRGSASIVDLTGQHSRLDLGKWTQVSGPNIATIGDPVITSYFTSTEISNLIPGKYTFRTEVSYNDTTVSENAEVYVVENTRLGNEYHFDTNWIFEQDWDYIVKTQTPVKPELFYNASGKTMDVHIKLHDRDEWIRVSENYDDQNFYYYTDECSTYITIFGHYPQHSDLIDKKLTIRVGFK